MELRLMDVGAVIILGMYVNRASRSSKLQKMDFGKSFFMFWMSA